MIETVNFGCAIDTAAAPNDVAVIDLGADGNPRVFSYRDLDATAMAAARGFLRQGLKRGDAVVFLGNNSFEYLAFHLGAMRAGLVSVPLNPRLPPATMAALIEDSEARLVCAEPWAEPALGGRKADVRLDRAGCEAFLDHGPFTPVVPGPDEPALILYTSGSTGRPKGVVLSHRSQIYVLDNYAEVRPLLKSCRVLVPAPLFHMNAQICSLITLQSQGTVVLMPRFEVKAYLRAIHDHKVGVLTGIPTMLALMLAEKELLAQLDLSSVTTILVGSAPLSESLVANVRTMFPKAAILNSYGTTECGAGLFGRHPDGIPRPVLSLGYPSPRIDWRLVGGDTPDQGVLQIRSPGAMNGYKNLPDVTAQRIRDGWYDTGDVMRRDENGFFFFVGRADDMFVCNGENIYPAEVEKLLETHPSVEQACVVPVADERRGQMPVAFIVAAPGTQPDPEDVKGFTLAHGPAHAHPRHVFVLPVLPMMGPGKIDRSALRRQAEETVAASAADAGN